MGQVPHCASCITVLLVFTIGVHTVVATQDTNTSTPTQTSSSTATPSITYSPTKTLKLSATQSSSELSLTHTLTYSSSTTDSATLSKTVTLTRSKSPQRDSSTPSVTFSITLTSTKTRSESPSRATFNGIVSKTHSASDLTLSNTPSGSAARRTVSLSRTRTPSLAETPTITNSRTINPAWLATPSASRTATISEANVATSTQTTTRSHQASISLSRTASLTVPDSRSTTSSFTGSLSPSDTRTLSETLTTSPTSSLSSSRGLSKSRTMTLQQMTLTRTASTSRTTTGSRTHTLSLTASKLLATHSLSFSETGSATISRTLSPSVTNSELRVATDTKTPTSTRLHATRTTSKTLTRTEEPARTETHSEPGTATSLLYPTETVTGIGTSTRSQTWLTKEPQTYLTPVLCIVVAFPASALGGNTSVGPVSRWSAATVSYAVAAFRSATAAVLAAHHLYKYDGVSPDDIHVRAVASLPGSTLSITNDADSIVLPWKTPTQSTATVISTAGLARVSFQISGAYATRVASYQVFLPLALKTTALGSQLPWMAAAPSTLSQLRCSQQTVPAGATISCFVTLRDSVGIVTKGFANQFSFSLTSTSGSMTPLIVGAAVTDGAKLTFPITVVGESGRAYMLHAKLVENFGKQDCWGGIWQSGDAPPSACNNTVLLTGVSSTTGTEIIGSPLPLSVAGQFSSSVVYASSALTAGQKYTVTIVVAVVQDLLGSSIVPVYGDATSPPRARIVLPDGWGVEDVAAGKAWWAADVYSCNSTPAGAIREIDPYYVLIPGGFNFTFIAPAPSNAGSLRVCVQPYNSNKAFDIAVFPVRNNKAKARTLLATWLPALLGVCGGLCVLCCALLLILVVCQRRRSRKYLYIATNGEPLYPTVARPVDMAWQVNMDEAEAPPAQELPDMNDDDSPRAPPLPRSSMWETAESDVNSQTQEPPEPDGVEEDENGFVRAGLPGVPTTAEPQPMNLPEQIRWSDVVRAAAEAPVRNDAWRIGDVISDQMIAEYQQGGSAALYLMHLFQAAGLSPRADLPPELYELMRMEEDGLGLSSGMDFPDGMPLPESRRSSDGTATLRRSVPSTSTVPNNNSAMTA
eukprot:TRINITY_DN43392_c0_g1_i1.p1 TRINITY_DN43392_c0_g1~~TRINITY_DN43392_c0_g1_i1.p1  ORF type:complete len:1094 (-),score=93.26 TRINITY_DN43392_c0_g1_i1:52-3333(-)